MRVFGSLTIPWYIYLGRYINECAVKANGGSFETPVVRLESQKGITHFPLHAASTDRANFP